MNPSLGLRNQAHRSICSDTLLCALLLFLKITLASYGRRRPEWLVYKGEVTNSHYNAAPPPRCSGVFTAPANKVQPLHPGDFRTQLQATETSECSLTPLLNAVPPSSVSPSPDFCFFFESAPAGLAICIQLFGTGYEYSVQFFRSHAKANLIVESGVKMQGGGLLAVVAVLVSSQTCSTQG